jgi:hypothetical protein
VSSIADDERHFYQGTLTMGTYRHLADRRYWVSYGMTNQAVHLRAPRRLITDDFGNLVDTTIPV